MESLVELTVTVLLLTPTLLAASAIATSALAEFQRMQRVKRLLQTFDEGLSVLGKSSVKAIYAHLKRQYALEREDVPVRLGLFHTGLVSLLGSKGAILVEKQIAKNTCS